MHTALKGRRPSQGNDSVSAHSLGIDLEVDPRNEQDCQLQQSPQL